MAIKIYKAVIGDCYTHADDGRYLGKFVRTDAAAARINMGFSPHSRPPIYVFEAETIGDNYPSDMIVRVPCAWERRRHAVIKHAQYWEKLATDGGKRTRRNKRRMIGGTRRNKRRI